jgi:hypothetical protein
MSFRLSGVPAPSEEFSSMKGNQDRFCLNAALNLQEMNCGARAESECFQTMRFVSACCAANCFNWTCCNFLLLRICKICDLLDKLVSMYQFMCPAQILN